MLSLSPTVFTEPALGKRGEVRVRDEKRSRVPGKEEIEGQRKKEEGEVDKAGVRVTGKRKQTNTIEQFERNTHLRNTYSFSQNSGFDIIVWNGVSEMDPGEAGITDASNTSGMSTSTSPGLGVSDGDGESTTDGIRP